MSRRYYIHGDEKETKKGFYFCVHCDLFEEKEHFNTCFLHKNNLKKYFDSLDNLKKADRRFKSSIHRPKNASNLFSDFERPKEKNGSYYRWLKKQIHRDDPIGDLANDAISDSYFPKESSSFKRIKGYLIFKCACLEAHQALLDSFDEYKNKSKNRSGINLKLRYEIFRHDNYRCCICGASANEDNVKLEIDHKIPKSKGGSDERENLWTLCFNCNRGKGNLSL